MPLKKNSRSKIEKISSKNSSTAGFKLRPKYVVEYWLLVLVIIIVYQKMYFLIRKVVNLYLAVFLSNCRSLSLPWLGLKDE